jgi:membrane associated rhomboid family serine protease
MIPLKDNIKTRTFPLVNALLIAGNIYGFVQEVTQPDKKALLSFLDRWSLIPSVLAQAPDRAWVTILSSMFLHMGWAHLIGNMMYLWIFGTNVEDRMGHRRYLFFYLLCGVFAALAQVSLFPTAKTPMIGASGAIAGVMGAYFLLYPKAKITALVPIWIFLRVMEVPAILFLGFWFLLQAFQGWGALAGGAAGGVAWWAHAGGFLAGGVLVFIFRQPDERSGGSRRRR